VKTVTASTAMPAVEKLYCRSACCCYYCGCHFKDCNNCCACFSKHDLLCDLYRQNAGFKCTNEEGARALVSCKGGCKGLACEAWDRGCVVALCAKSCLCCWCCEAACFSSTQCLCERCMCTHSRGQTCCVYQRSALPTTNDTPCEIGCCGIFCLSKSTLIKEWESEHPDEVGYNDSVFTVAVPVPKEDYKASNLALGAPVAPESNAMDDRKGL